MFAKSYIAVLISLTSLVAISPGANAADRIQFPENELASESVLPIFDQPVSVKNRRVLTARRIEIGALGGLSLMEPFYNPMNFGLSGSYHLTEEHAIDLSGVFFMQGLSNNARGLNPIPGAFDSGGNPISANLQYAPSTKYMVFANYQYTAFYGKISLTKDFVMNLSTYGFAGLGMVGVGDASKPVVNFGLGEKFYVTPSLALRVDFKVYLYNGPDVLSRRLDAAKSEQPAASFEEKLNYGSLLSVGAVYILPAL